MGVILRTGLWLNAGVTGSLGLLGYVLSHWLLGLFITLPEVLAQAEHLLHIMLWSMLLFGFQSVVGGTMRASGVVWVPVAYGLSTRFGLEGVWMAFRWPTQPCWRCGPVTTGWCGGTKKSPVWFECAGHTLRRG